MRLTFVLALPLCLGLGACKWSSSSSAARVNADGDATATRSAIAGTVHGSPVDANKVVLLNVTDDQLVAFLGGNSSGTAGGATPGGETAYALQGADSPYMRACRAKGVPIPPPWGDPKWVNLGTLPADRIFALDPRLTTTVYRAEFPNGVCAALPRVRSDGRIEALGMICQGADGSACFWDNVDVLSNAKITDPASIRPELMSDGSNLQENCSECHRGDNVFIVHVGTPLENIQQADPTESYQPVDPQIGWANPAGNASLAANCQSCHTLPKLSFGYCSNVLMPTIRGTSGRPTMPPEGEDPADYATDIQELTDACKAEFTKGGFAWPFGA